MKRNLKSLVCLALTLPLLSSCVSYSASPLENPADEDATFTAELKIEYIEDADSEAELSSLECGGQLPASDSCEWLRNNSDALLNYMKPEVCTLIFGGEQKVIISGSLNGYPLSEELSRENGCALARWEQWEPLLQSVSGVDVAAIELIEAGS